MRDESKLITTSDDWTPELLETFYSHIERIAEDYLQIDYFPNQIEIISSEQMLDAYSSVGMPVMYNHWSFGKSFVGNHQRYQKGQMGLAYEIVINSDPCIAYCMEENTMMMQALVMAHASFGHNGFFKGNYLFQQWTQPDAIIDYLVFAKKFVAECEERYGEEEVEAVLDAAHALQNYGVDRYKRPPKMNAAQEESRRKEREEYTQSQINELWATLPTKQRELGQVEDEKRFPEDPQENILYFIEKNAPMLPSWKRELIRVVRKIAQYFYPQRQTQLMNEGYATFTHYNIMNKMYDEGLVNDGFMMQFYDSHTAVTNQPDFDSPYYSGINPYALGFAMYQDIKRVSTEPTDEDREWFGNAEWVGRGDWVEQTNWAMKNFKDESFVRQFLTPKVMRDFHMFSIVDDESDDMLECSAIHNTAGYKRIRTALADQYTLANNEPNIQVYNVDRAGDRSLTLRHFVHNDIPLAEQDTFECMKHLRTLWEFDVNMESVDIHGSLTARFELTERDAIYDVFI
jgi:stage V sporulation protein R